MALITSDYGKMRFRAEHGPDRLGLRAPAGDTLSARLESVQTSCCSQFGEDQDCANGMPVRDERPCLPATACAPSHIDGRFNGTGGGVVPAG